MPEAGARGTEKTGADTGQSSADERVLRTILDAAARRVPGSRVEQQTRRLLPRGTAPYTANDAADLRELAIDVLLFKPDPRGATAFDRLARSPDPAWTQAERGALERLRTSRFRVFTVALADDGTQYLQDAVSGAPIRLQADLFRPGETVAMRTSAAADGLHSSVSFMLLLPHGPDDIPWDLVTRDATGFRNPSRAAERIYQAVVADAVTRDQALEDYFVTAGPAEASPDSCAADRLGLTPDAPDIVLRLAELADAWTSLGTDDPAQLDPEGTRWLRRETDPYVVYGLVSMADRLPEGDRLQRVLERMTLIALDTVARRADVGLGLGMSEFEATHGIAERTSQRVRDRLARLRARVRTGGSDTADDSELTRVIGRIRALQAKTVEAGCSEAEAIAAAEKAEELLLRYDITLTPEQLADHGCTLARVQTPRKRWDGLDDCVQPIARFCECWSWIERDAANNICHAFFGLPTDVAAAESLFTLAAATFDRETAAFKAGKTYAATPSNRRGKATKSFRSGLGAGIAAKLSELHDQRVRRTAASSGYDLVPLKTKAIETAFERLGLDLSLEKRNHRIGSPAAFDQGMTSGKSFQPDPGVTGR